MYVSARTLTNEAGRITDRYSYDAYGNLLEKEGDTENEFLYTGEQYNANTGLRNDCCHAVTDKSGTVRYTYDKYDRLSKQSLGFPILEKRCI